MKLECCRLNLMVAMASIALLAACSSAKPVTSLKAEQTGTVRFYSWDASYADLGTGQVPSKRVIVSGELSLPEGRSGPVPAVVINHNQGGIGASEKEAAKLANSWGWAAMIVDSYSERGVTRRNARTEAPSSYSVADAFAALDLLATDPAIDKSRIVAVGFSRGGNVNLLADDERAVNAFASRGERFAAFVSFYPGSCTVAYKTPRPTSAEQLVLMGALDPTAPLKKCQHIFDRIKGNGKQVEEVVYPKAYHAFSDPRFAGRTTPAPSEGNWSGCADHFVEIQNDGNLHATWVGKTFANQQDLFDKTGGPFAGCTHGKSTYGGPISARTQALGAFHALLDRIAAK